jgi:aspartate aminotransferase
MAGKMTAGRVQGIEISGIRRLFEAAGPGSINLGLGQPDYDTPHHIKEAAIRAIREGKTMYTPNAGIPELRQAIADKLVRENRLSYTPQQILVTAGGSEALHLAMEALVEPGDRVVFSDPGFVSYAALALIAGGVPIGVPLNDTLHMDVERTKEAMDGARILVINSPANPTGMVESPGTIRGLVEYAMDAGVTVVSDEVYEHFIYGNEHASAARFGEDVVTVNAASKTYAMTGWRLGYLAGPEAYIEPFLKVHQYCQACATSISQYAALAGYTGDQQCVAMMREEYRTRRDLFHAGMREIGIDFPEPEGAFYAFVPFGEPLLARVLAHGVVVVPGSAFGRSRPHWARVCYAVAREQLQLAVARIADAMGEET